MWVICTDTNAIIGGVPVCYGNFELPFHGSVGVLTSGGCTTNFQAGAGDTLAVWPQGAALLEGPDAMVMFLAGVSLVVTVFGVMGVARKLTRSLKRMDVEV